MEIVKVKVYPFKELSPETKRHIIDSLKISDGLCSIKIGLKKFIGEMLRENKIIFEDLEVWYSLKGYDSDDVMFTGNFVLDGKPYKVINESPIGYGDCISIFNNDFRDEQKELVVEPNSKNPFVKIYLAICDKALSQGYLLDCFSEEFIYDYVEDLDAKYLKNGVVIDNDFVEE